MTNDLSRQNQLLSERLEWYQQERKRLLKSILLKFWLNLICLSGGMSIGAILMFLLYRCP